MAVSHISKILGIEDGPPLENILEFVGEPDTTSEVSKEFRTHTPAVNDCLFEAYKKNPALRGYLGDLSFAAVTGAQKMRNAAREILERVSDQLLPDFIGEPNEPIRLLAKCTKLDPYKLAEASKIADKCVLWGELDYQGVEGAWALRTIRALYRPIFGDVGQESFRGVERLDLHGDRLATLSSEVAVLTQLRVLDLRHNLLEDLPPEIERLSQLRELDLDSNHFTQLRPEIFRLTQLIILSLGYNRIENISSEIRQLTELRVLELQGNRLRSVPVELGELAHLRRLSLQHNPNLLLSGEVRAVLANIPIPNGLAFVVHLDNHHPLLHPALVPQAEQPALLNGPQADPLLIEDVVGVPRRSQYRIHMDMLANVRAQAANIEVVLRASQARDNELLARINNPPAVNIGEPQPVAQPRQEEPLLVSAEPLNHQTPASLWQQAQAFFAGLFERFVAWLQSVQDWLSEEE